METTIDLNQVESYAPSNVSAQNLLFFYNLIVGTPFNNFLHTTFLNDFVVALGGDDRIFGSWGYDIFVGGTGNDTADYSDLGQAITLKATGIVDKGFLGFDQLYEIETIVGAIGQTNVIDGSTHTSTTTSLNVNLANQSLLVNSVPGIGTLKFNVQNFVNVIGTSQNDTIFGDNNNNFLDGRGGNDTVFGLGGNDTVLGGTGNDVIGGGSKSSIFIYPLTEDKSLIPIFSDGNDVVKGESGDDSLIGGTGYDFLDGGTGSDTADYGNLFQAITLEAVGVVNKGFAGTDIIQNIEKIIGAKGRANAIDGSTGTSTTTSLDVNLAQERLVVNGIPGLGSAKFQVQNFVNVTGTSQADHIVGNDKNNILEGGKGNDNISGLSGKDTLIGVDSTSFNPGRYEIDILTGGADADKFVIGDEKSSYYVGGGGFFGLNDYAFITDFEKGVDKIQLNESERYIFGRNFIAVNRYFYPLPYEIASDDVLTSGGDALTANNLDISATESAVDDLINLGTTETVDGTTSSESSLLLPYFPSFDIVAIFADNYSYSNSDIDFV